MTLTSKTTKKSVLFVKNLSSKAISATVVMLKGVIYTTFAYKMPTIYNKLLKKTNLIGT